MFAIDSALPQTLRVGAGSALFVSGWIFSRRARLDELTLRLGEVEQPVRTHSMPRLDVYVALARPGDEPVTAAYRSGFWAVLPVPGVTEPTEAALELRAANEAGERFGSSLASIRLLPRETAPAAAPDPGLVAVCMTTCDPDLELFGRQVESIRGQTHERWRCIVNDDASDPEIYAGIEKTLAGDPRFELHRNRERLGFYFNFERALERVPADAEAVALCDQDDAWHPAKLATLLASLREGHTLVYSDQRIVSTEGELLAPGFWTRRENQWTDLGALVVSNTVTGAAALFRRDLLDVALPFPPRLAGAYHDHWIALTALACGTLGYVDEPLYDYVQHVDQVVGHVSGKDATEAAPPPPRRPPLVRWQYAYFAHVVPAQFAAVALLERCGPRLRPADRDALAALADGDSTRRGIGAQLRSVPALRAQRDGEAFATLAGMAWRRWTSWRTRPPRVPIADQRHNLDARPAYAEYGPGSGERAPDQPGSGRLRRPWRTK
jgi:hypothetical protein